MKLDASHKEAQFAYRRHIEVTAHPHESSDCRRASEVLSRVGDKWSVLVVMQLASEPRRFNELKRLIGGISQRMLTLTLRQLEHDGLVSRTVHATVPPRVDYALTDLGESVLEPISALIRWANEHGTHIADARRRYEAEHAATEEIAN
mgnify:CR=1 FL=1